MDLGAPGLEIVGRDRLAEEVISLFRAITAEAARRGHLVHGRVKGGDAGRRQGIGDVTDAQLDHLPFGIGALKGSHPLGDLGKEIGSLQLQIVLVHPQHRKFLVKKSRSAFGRGYIFTLTRSPKS